MMVLERGRSFAIDRYSLFTSRGEYAIPCIDRTDRFNDRTVMILPI